MDASGWVPRIVVDSVDSSDELPGDAVTALILDVDVPGAPFISRLPTTRRECL
jgi:hypothetical protein